MIFADVTKTERWHVRSCPISEAAEPKVCIGGANLTAEGRQFVVDDASSVRAASE